MSEPSYPDHHHQGDDAVDLRRLFAVIWSGKFLIAGLAAASAIVCLIVTLFLPDTYRAEALLAPNHQDGISLLSSRLNQFSGLAGLAGLSLDDNRVNKTALGLEILKSRQFIADFIQRHNLLVPLMAAEDWDSKNRELIIDADQYDAKERQWVRKVRAPKKQIPSSLESYEEFMMRLTVSQNKKSGFVTLSFEHYSPDLAKQWVDWLTSDLNSSVMQRDVAEAQQAIVYLYEQIASTPLTDLHKVFFKLIEEQTKTVMLARVSPEYLFRVIDPAVIPEEKIKPARLVVTILAMLGGAMFAVIFVLLRNRVSESYKV